MKKKTENKNRLNPILLLAIIVLALFASPLLAQKTETIRGLIGDTLGTSGMRKWDQSGGLVCKAGTDFTLSFDVSFSELLGKKVKLPIEWDNRCDNETKMLSYTVTESSSDLVPNGFKLMPLAEGGTVTFPAASVAKDSLYLELSGDNNTKPGLHTATLLVKRSGTEQEDTRLFVELMVSDDITALSLDTLARDSTYFTDPVNTNAAYDESIIFSIADGGYKTKSGAILTEKNVAKLPVKPFACEGLTADGNTRLLLRARVKVANLGALTPEEMKKLEAQFQLDTEKHGLSAYLPPKEQSFKLETLDRKKSETDNISIPLEQVDQDTLQATAVLVAPKYLKNRVKDIGFRAPIWNGGFFDVKIKIAGLNTDSLSELVVTKKLAQPPVVFLHGFNSDSPNSWGAPFPPLDQNVRAMVSETVLHYIALRDYTYKHYSYEKGYGPTEVMPENEAILHETLLAGLAEQRSKKNVAVSQVDLIGHSMGGLVARKYLDDNKYFLGKEYNYTNYKNGPVRYLITTGTPHNGTPFADYLAGYATNFFKPYNEYHVMGYLAIIGALRSLGDLGGYDRIISADGTHLTNALDDLSQRTTGGKSYVKRLNEKRPLPAVPMHAVAGNVDDLLVMPEVDYIFRGMLYFYNDIPKEDTYRVFFDGDGSDGFVPLSSATWPVRNIPRAWSHSPVDGAKFMHTSMTKQSWTAETVIDLLCSGSERFAKGYPVERKSVGSFSMGQQTYLRNSPAPNREKQEAVSSDLRLQISRTSAKPGETVGLTATMPMAKRGKLRFYVHDMYGEQAELGTMDASGGTANFSYHIPLSSSGKERMIAMFIPENKSGELFISNIVELSVIFDMSGLVGLATIPADYTVLPMGLKSSLYALGEFKDGSRRYISDAAFGTHYSVVSGDSGVVSISEDGEVTGLKQGEVVVRVQNGAHSDDIRVRIMSALKDVRPDTSPNEDATSGGSGSGGCSTAAFAGLFVIVGMFLLRKNGM